MSKITIIEGNSDDKDQVRTFMVKGEKGDNGVSPTVETSKFGNMATIVITDEEGEHEFVLFDGVSPTVETSKTGKVTTITITDAEGTHTATINDGEVNVINTFDTLVDKTTNAPSIHAVEEYVGDMFETIETTLTATAGYDYYEFPIDFPTGFNKSNCVVIAGMINNQGTSNPTWRYIEDLIFLTKNYQDQYEVNHYYELTMGDIFNVYPNKLLLRYNPGTVLSNDVTFSVRIVLMKMNV